LWELNNSFLYSEKGYEKTFQTIANPVGGNELLFNHYAKSIEVGSNVSENVKKDGIDCSIILLFLHAYTDLPPRYQTILATLKTEINSHPDYSSTSCLLLSLSLLATTPSNRKILYNNGFHSVIFNLLVKEGPFNRRKLYASQALCNMTCEESSDLKNNILNSDSFIKLKKLMDKIICSSPESVADKSVAQKNAIIIENILLLLSNMLVGNQEALTPIINSGFISHILNHLSPDTDDRKRQDAENITNQQKSALRVLHSITFHQTDHIDTLKTNNVLTCVKICMSSGDKEIIE
jgi:hypothetical protein